MTQVTIEQAVQLAIGCQQSGRLTEAEAIYRQILGAIPNHPDSLHMLGVICSQTGRTKLATDLIRQAIAVAPGNAEYHYNLGAILRGQSDVDEAINCYLRALEIKPTLIEARFNLANAWKMKGNLDQAIDSYRKTLEIMPNHAGAFNNLGNALKDKQEAEQAIECYRQALKFKPEYPEAQVNLANTLRDTGRLQEAIDAYARAKDLKPNYAEAHLNLGIAQWKLGKLKDSVASYRQAIAMSPNYAEAYFSLGIALKANDQTDEAIACYERALRIKPDHSEARNNLAGILWESGQLDRAIACYRTTINLNPRFISAHDNLVYAQHFHPDSTPQTLLDESRQWSNQHAEALERDIRGFANTRDPDRRLRIGYVSPDFRKHPVGRSLLPVMQNHDKDRFEAVCYSSVTEPDALTQRIRGCASLWRDVQLLSDEKLAEQIRDDRIDILVDLSLHMSGNRLLAFARRPAPIQVTWLGYPGTTGLATMDYRLSDPYMDPPGQMDHYYTEKTVRVPHTFQVYDPLTQELSINTPPAATAGYVTLGCLNNFAKINEPLLQTWARILSQSKRARMVLKTASPSAAKWAMDIFSAHGVSSDRVEIVGDLPSHEAYLMQYQRLDLALDPFPYNGHTTSMDAIWMGVPVLSRYGTTAVSRAGLSQTSNLGLPNLAVGSDEEYIRAAVELIGDLPQLAELRRTLRPRMQASPLMDAPGFARGLEDAMRRMWRDWCGRAYAP